MLRRLAAPVLLLAAGAAGAQVQASGAVPAASQLADRVVVHKAARTLDLYADGRLIRHIPGIQLGRDPFGPKRFAGDGRTPEGRYTVDRGNSASAYHLSLHISYPAPADRAQALAQGRSPGGDIFLHGQPNDWRRSERVPGDWTDGCIALANSEIEYLWQTVGDGTIIEIVP